MVVLPPYLNEMYVFTVLKGSDTLMSMMSVFALVVPPLAIQITVSVNIAGIECQPCLQS